MWYKRAADQGFVESMYRTGRCYENGYGVAIDEFAAFKYFKLAAEAGNVIAQCSVGAC
jgi:TPR repeat protein